MVSRKSWLGSLGRFEVGYEVFEWFLKGDLKYFKLTQEEDTCKYFVVSDYVVNIDTTKSLSGFVFMLFGITTSWKTIQQSAVELSNTQEE